MKMDVLVIAHFTVLENENGNNRFLYIVEMLSRHKNVSVELVTSSFYHFKKQQRDTNITRRHNSYKTTLLFEPSYSRNLTLKRFYSHYKLAQNLEKYLETRQKPDVIYCAVPSLDLALAAGIYATEHQIKYILDIQDLWPEAFRMILPSVSISNILFSVMRRKAETIYSLADEIVAVSQTYADRGMKCNKKCKKGYCVYLGTDLKVFDYYCNKNKIIKKHEGLILVYIGTLGASYNLTIFIDALKLLKEQGLHDISLVIMGEGPLKKKILRYAKTNKIQLDYKGSLPYCDMVSVLASCDVAINPITKRTAASIINKVGDYAMAGLPVISTLESEEYKQLIEEYNIGYHVKFDAYEISETIKSFYQNPDLRREMGANNRRLAQEKFDRNRTYKVIKSIILDNKSTLST